MIDLDAAVKFMKNIVDDHKCINCDKLEGTRIRYSCGHTTCSECAIENTCRLCYSPPDIPNNEPVVDEVYSQRVEHVLHLLRTFQKAFKVDVYARHRLSEQLKIEKEVFPGCIQAPQKYYNRKSVTRPTKDKENRSFIYAGECISPIKMDKTMYIQKWLDESKDTPEKRTPFRDLNVNTPHAAISHRNKIKRRADIILQKVNENQASKNTRKRSFKSALSSIENQLHLDNFVNKADKKDTSNNKINYRLKNHLKTFESKAITNKKDNEESDIVLEDDTVIIEDSESVDKDKLAWLAVLEAAKKEAVVTEKSDTEYLKLEWSNKIECINNVEKSPTIESNTHESHNIQKRIPFYKKGPLNEHQLGTVVSAAKDLSYVVPSKNISITIENPSCTTTIEISTVKTEQQGKQSVAIQADRNCMDLMKESDTMPTSILENQVTKGFALKKAADEEPPSQDLFTADDTNIHSKTESKKPKEAIDVLHKTEQNLVINSSDSDDDNAEESSVLTVTAEVHRSSNELENNVLLEIEQSNLENRTRHPRRGLTPTSTDSSEKENFDPNKAKRSKLTKKKSK